MAAVPSSGVVRVAAVQHDIVWCDRAANVERFAPMVSRAVDLGARLVVFTETFTTGFATDRPDLGEPRDGPSATFLAEQARRHGIWVGGTYAELPGGGPGGDLDERRPANVFGLFGPDGVVGRYAKRHLFGHGGEDRFLRPGDDHLPTWELDGVGFTPLVCYDLRFAPDPWAAADRTDCYLVPANWPAARRTHWSALLTARAIENQAWVVGVNRVGTGGPIDYAGDTVVIDPLGEVVAHADPGVEQIVVADVSAEQVRGVRAAYPFLDDR